MFSAVKDLLVTPQAAVITLRDGTVRVGWVWVCNLDEKHAFIGFADTMSAADASADVTLYSYDAILALTPIDEEDREKWRARDSMYLVHEGAL